MDVLFPRSHYVRDCNPLPSPPTRTPPGVRVMGIPDQQKVLEGTVQLVHSSQVNLACFSSFFIGNHLFPHRGSIKFQVQDQTPAARVRGENHDLDAQSLCGLINLMGGLSELLSSCLNFQC